MEPTPKPLQTAIDRDAVKSTFFAGIDCELRKISAEFGVGRLNDLDFLHAGQLSLAAIERAIRSAEAPLPPKATTELKATRAFVNNVIIPHVDAFIATALLLEERTEPVDWSSCPSLARHAGHAADPQKLAALEQGFAETMTVGKPQPFAEIRDPAKGTHFERLRRALAQVDGSIADFTQTFRRLAAAIGTAVEEVDLSEAQRLLAVADIERARSGNAFLQGRADEMLLLAKAKVASAEKKNEMVGKLNALQWTTYGLSKLFKGWPLLEGATEMLHESTGGHHAIINRNARQTNLAVAQVEADAQREVAAMLKERTVPVDSLKRQLETLSDRITALKGEADMVALDQDKTRQRAIADAFVNKAILTFGLRMSTALEETAREHQIASIDALLGAFLETNPRLGEALQNLAFGFADSNDLSVILAEAALVKPGRSREADVLKAFAEGVMKPNIAALFNHGSKVDIIYQSNLSGLGSACNAARVMIRSAHDTRVSALFSDAFGVRSELGGLTVRGALDVKNIFDFYLHRHGDRTVTDAKERDGTFTGEHVEKRVSTLPQGAIASHVEMVKTAKGLRQSAPEISDMPLAHLRL